LTDIERLKELRSTLRLEIAGIRSKGKTVYAILRAEFDLKGCRKEMLGQLNDMIKEEEKR
jgi:hypothetical protein